MINYRVGIKIGDRMNESEFKEFLYRNGIIDNFLKENGYIYGAQEKEEESSYGDKPDWLFLENHRVPILARFEITPLSFTILREIYSESSKAFVSRPLVKYSTEWQKYLAKNTGNYMDYVSQYIFQKCNDIEEEDCYRRDEILKCLEVLRTDEDSRQDFGNSAMTAKWTEDGKNSKYARKPLGEKNRYMLLQKIESELAVVAVKKENHPEQ